MVSNFDLKNSEISQIINLSNFHSVCMPRFEVDDMKELIEERLEIDRYNTLKVDSIFNVSINAYFNNFVNLNEVIYNMSENLETYCKEENEYNRLNKSLQKLNFEK